MIMKYMSAFVTIGMLLFVPSLHAAEQTAAAQDSMRDPQVMNRLDSMGQYLRSLKVFALHADTTTDEVLENGQKLQFAGAADYLVQTPDRMRLELKNDFKHRIYTYDSQSLTQYSPQLGYYTTMEITGTNGEMVLQVKKKYDLDMPLVDLFLWGTDEADTKGIKVAAFVGVEQMNGHDSEHYAFRQEGVDWQVWIQPGDQPLPDKLVITDTEDPSQPSFVANLQWDLSPKTQEKDFIFVPPKGAMKIDIVSLEPAAKK
jgi:hypothetical protein